MATRLVHPGQEQEQTMIAAKLGAHALITLGASIIVWLVTNLPTTQMITIWTIFTVAALAADLLLLTVQPQNLAAQQPRPIAPSLFDLFEEIDDHDPSDFGPMPHQRANWVHERPSGYDHPHGD
jgi:hypothetical protein